MHYINSFIWYSRKEIRVQNPDQWLQGLEVGKRNGDEGHEKTLLCDGDILYCGGGGGDITRSLSNFIKLCAFKGQILL